MLCTFVLPCTVQAAENEASILTEEAVYDLNLGGTQKFTIIDSDGNIAYITISKEPGIYRVDNGTYKVTYEESGNWKAGYYVVISNNSITSVKDKFYSVSSGYLVLVTTNAAHLYTKPVWGYYAMGGVEETIPSGTALYTTTFGTKNSHDSYTAGFNFSLSCSISQIPEVDY